MDFDHEFSVAAPIDDVWAAITDIQRVAPCVPDAQVTGPAGDDGVRVEISVSAGPLDVTSEGTITVTERDDAAHREVLTVVAAYANGDALADATVTIVLSEAGEGTAAAVHSTVEVSGVAGLVGQGTLDSIAADTIREFAENLAALLRPATSPA
ncbi:MAG TPA: SRPBCC domain-containing protein [Solirubrobacteraceae bacterium]|nr:SRPBCC domain-containing protein [Solirubrobacteraceae bacterium]